MNRHERRQADKRDKVQQKTLFRQLDNIYDTCAHIAKKWDLKTVPLVVLKEAIKHGAPKPNSGNEYSDIIIKTFTNTINILYADMEKLAKVIKVEKVPLSEIKSWISKWKSVYSESMRSKLTNEST